MVIQSHTRGWIARRVACRHRCQIVQIHIKAKKPTWKLGSSFSLKKPVKSLLLIDDDMDLIDEDHLLSEEDLKKPQLPPAVVRCRLEQESGYYFNMLYIEEMVANGQWEEVVKYLHGFTKVEDNCYSMKVFFEIQKQKFLEALDRNDHPKACQILHKDLKVFSGFNQELYKEVTTFGSRELQHVFTENEQLSKYADAKTARSVMLAELKKLIEANPLFRDKLRYPSFKSQRLRTLINQRLQLLLGEMICVIKLSKLEF
ncbi:protein TOPLESS [Artemisia annua]|uniref:Protein TOPLESS n=1 Tax=Artemisia annua TaxID=35608 RepID=A0A2U1K8T6_ARTAN|nr:protein TOPLESS [Artemisia annua]